MGNVVFYVWKWLHLQVPAGGPGQARALAAAEEPINCLQRLRAGIPPPAPYLVWMPLAYVWGI